MIPLFEDQSPSRGFLQSRWPFPYLTKLSPALGNTSAAISRTPLKAVLPRALLTLCPHQGQCQASSSFPPKGTQLPMETAHGLETVFVLQAEDQDDSICPA